MYTPLNSMDANKQEAKTAYPTKAYTRQEIEQFRLYRPELEEKLRSGSLCYAVEWWENDSIDIDENALIFFCFQNEDYVWEFVLNRQIHDEVKEMLATIGVDWEYHFKAQFGSYILYPPSFAGQPYYEKAPQEPKKWWERLFHHLLGLDEESWIRRKDLP